MFSCKSFELQNVTSIGGTRFGLNKVRKISKAGARLVKPS